MSRVLRYQGEFVNTETTRPDNINIQQTCVLKIYDTEFIELRFPITTAAIFYDTPDKIRVPATDWFYVGQVFTVVGVSANVGPFTVNSIVEVGADIDIFVDENTVGFFETSAVFTDTVGGSPDPEVIPLEMAEQPISISVIDNSEDKFTPVRSKQLQANVFTGNGIDISLFAEGGDQKWYVEYLVNDIMKFIGYLSISDLVQDFMPDPNVLILTATDGLGFISDIPLVNFDGDNPQNENQIIDYIAWALAKTGLQLPIVVCMNIRERFATPLVSDDSGDGHFYKHEWIDAKTFEKEIGESEDCRTVLEKIFGEMCTVSQDNGTWLIKRVDEFEFDHPDYLFTFDYQGTFIEATEETPEKNIGVDLPMAWMNDDAQVLLERAYKLIKHNYKYITPQEIICNQDFSRGDLILDSGLTKRFTIDTWSRVEIVNSDGAESPSTDFEAYIEKTYDEQGDVLEQYAVIESGTLPVGSKFFIKSCEIPISAKDKFDFSLDFRFRTDYGADDEFIALAIFVLFGTDGSKWIFTREPTFPYQEKNWVLYSTADFFWSLAIEFVPDDVDETLPQSVSTVVPAVPVDGKLVIYLGAYNSVLISMDILYSNIIFGYKPYINGSYLRYTGQEHKVQQGVNTVAVREAEVFLDTSPKKLFKGALLKEEDADFTLANEFYNAALDPDGNFADDDLIMPFGKLRAFDVWNQFNRLMRVFDGTVDGLESSTTIPDLKHRYTLTDGSNNTDNKMFMLLHFEQEHHLCEMPAFLHEVADSTIDKDLTGHSFKYLTSE